MAKKKTFSVTKAVKLNARDRVGQPKASRVLDSRTKEEKRSALKPRLKDLLNNPEDE